MMVYAPNAVKLAYPDEARRIARVNLLKTPAGIMMGGPFFGGNETNLGVMMANELMLTLIVATSIMSILTVVRHTRAEEESGAAELVMSSVVSRYARTFAALVLVGAVNAILAITMTLALAATGFDLINCAGMRSGASPVRRWSSAPWPRRTVQLWRQARTATGAAMGVLAAAALVRGVGDITDHSGSTLSWLSPIAWAQQMRSFVELRWWPFALLVAATLALMGLSTVLETRREYDDGILPSRGDRVTAAEIRGVVQLNLVLQRGQVISWGVGLFLAGLAFGSMTKSLQDAAKTNELIARVLSTQGYNGLYTTLTQFLAAAATGFVVAAVLRLSQDEDSGIAEEVLAGAVSRWRWLLSNVGATLVGSAVLLLAAGLGNGLAAAVTMGQAELVPRLVGAGVAQVPAMAVMAGIGAVAVAVRRPLIGWLAVTFVVLALYLGALLRLPHWLIELSPVGRTTAPSNVPLAAIAVMVVAAAVLTAVAGGIYRHRDAI